MKRLKGIKIEKDEMGYFGTYIHPDGAIETYSANTHIEVYAHLKKRQNEVEGDNTYLRRLHSKGE